MAEIGTSTSRLVTWCIYIYKLNWTLNSTLSNYRAEYEISYKLSYATKL